MPRMFVVFALLAISAYCDAENSTDNAPHDVPVEKSKEQSEEVLPDGVTICMFFPVRTPVCVHSHKLHISQQTVLPAKNTEPIG